MQISYKQIALALRPVSALLFLATLIAPQPLGSLKNKNRQKRSQAVLHYSSIRGAGSPQREGARSRIETASSLLEMRLEAGLCNALTALTTSLPRRWSAKAAGAIFIL
jgi:hypothetical protein